AEPLDGAAGPGRAVLRGGGGRGAGGAVRVHPDAVDGDRAARLRGERRGAAGARAAIDARRGDAGSALAGGENVERAVYDDRAAGGGDVGAAARARAGIVPGAGKAAGRGVDRRRAEDMDGAAVLREDPRLSAGEVDGAREGVEGGGRDDRIAEHVDRLAGGDRHGGEAAAEQADILL